MGVAPQDEEQGTGLTRRELLRKGTLMGGALAWAVPTVQIIGVRAAYAQATSHALSYVAIVLKCGDDYFQVKWEDGGGYSAGGSLPCAAQEFEQWPNFAYTPGLPGGLPDPTFTPISDDLSKWHFNFSGTNCEIVWTLNKCAQICEITPSYPPGTNTVTFEPCQVPA
jgi:hypothetical protein